MATRKGEETKARIVEAALDLFRERGYEETTMRAVAAEAGVSLGNAYYYFKGKEYLLQAYYHRMQEDHVAAAQHVLDTETDLHARLLGVLNSKLTVIEPYHRFSGLLFRHAADPKSPLNPFNEASAEARQEGIDLYAKVLEGAKIKIPADIAPHLPGLMWTYSMGIVLFWLHDDSEGRQRTRALTTQTADLVVKVIRVLSNPLMRPLRKSALRVLESIQVKMQPTG